MAQRLSSRDHAQLIECSCSRQVCSASHRTFHTKRTPIRDQIIQTLSRCLAGLHIPQKEDSRRPRNAKESLRSRALYPVPEVDSEGQLR